MWLTLTGTGIGWWGDVKYGILPPCYVFSVKTFQYLYNYSLYKNCNFKPHCSFMTGGSERTCLLNDEDEQMLTRGAVWRRTGDLGRIDSKGNIFCLGRLDRQIKRHGKRLDLDTLEKVGFIRNVRENGVDSNRTCF